MSDRFTKVLLGVIAAGLLTIGSILSYRVLAPSPAEADSYYVELGAACNAYIPRGERPWCAEVVKLTGSKYSGGEIFVLATRNQK